MSEKTEQPNGTPVQAWAHREGLVHLQPLEAGAWTPDQVVDMLIDGMNQRDFYIICPDNDVTRRVDNRRILWAAQDITQNRPPLSRWHPDYKDAFEAFLKET